MNHSRPVWIRELRLRPLPGLPTSLAVADDVDLREDAGVHARSRFERLDAAGSAVYTLREARDAAPDLDPVPGEEVHTLVAVREFRRVPLDASGLALAIFRARPGRAAQLIAALAHWAERAVSLYQPTYLLLAHSLEQPRVVALIAGVRERRALQLARSSPFSVEPVLPEVEPLLEGEVELYSYCPDEAEETFVLGSVSPHAV